MNLLEWICLEGFAGADLPGRIRRCGSVEADGLNGFAMEDSPE